MINVKHKAKRPNFSDVEKEGDFSYVCKTCWQAVEQPIIKGIWYHSDDWQQHGYGCKKLIPIRVDKIDRDKKYRCNHELKFSDDLESALKCVKCGYAQRIDLLDQIDYRGDYYCFECKKQFKLVSQHFIKVHKQKGFEFRYE